MGGVCLTRRQIDDSRLTSKPAVISIATTGTIRVQSIDQALRVSRIHRLINGIVVNGLAIVVVQIGNVSADGIGCVVDIGQEPRRSAFIECGGSDICWKSQYSRQ